MKNQNSRSRLNIYLPNDIFDKLAKYADIYGISKSQLACFLIGRSIDAFYKTPNDNNII